MYLVGETVVYGLMGVCVVEAVGELDMQGADKGRSYYTLAPVHREGKIFAPVDTSVAMRRAMTREQAMELIHSMPAIERDTYESSNPRLLDEHYRTYLKSGDCVDLVRVVRTVYAKGRLAAEKGRRLGQVDERSMRRAEEMLYDELAFALEMRPDEVRDFICVTLGDK